MRFTAGFDQLADATISPAQQQQAIVNYYNNESITPSNARSMITDITALLPTLSGPKVSSGVLHCTIHRTKMRCGWTMPATAVHGRPPTRNSTVISEIVTRFDYDDAVLADTWGNIVHTPE